MAAPLDPWKVKAGDTVTLVGTKAKVEGEVEDVQKDTDELVIIQIDNLRFRVTGDDAWTLTDHQPAPEPEPEWKPGTVAEGTINGKAVRGVVGHALTGGDAAFVYWNEFAGHLSSTHTPPANLRPLVVIDPATVDVDALADRFDSAFQYTSGHGIATHQRNKIAMRAALAHLGIEAS